MTSVDGGAIGLDTTSGSALLATNLTDFTGGPSTGSALGLTKLGTNTLTLTGANSYTGPTTVRSGVLELKDVSGHGATVTGASQVIVNSPAATLAITGNITIGDGLADVNTTQGTLSIGGSASGTNGNLSLLDNALNTLTIKGNAAVGASNFLTLGIGFSGQASTLSFDLGNTATDQIVVTPTTVSGSGRIFVQSGGVTISLHQLAGTTLSNGTYNLLTYSTGSTFVGAFTLSNFVGAPGKFYYLTNTSTAEQLIVANGAGAGNAYWTGSQSAFWNTNPAGTTNFVTAFSGGANSALPSEDTNVFFTASTAANPANSLGQALTINSLNFMDLHVRGLAGTVTVYASPTSVGVATLACHTTAPTPGFADECDQVVATLRLVDVTAYPLGPSAAYGRTLSATFASLDRAAAPALAQLRSASTPSAQAAAARQLAGDYSQAAAKLSGAELTPIVRNANAAIVRAFRQISTGYTHAAAASAAHSASGYARADQEIARGSAALSRALKALEPLGYTVSG